MANFLNNDGVLYLWQKVKELVNSTKVTKTSELNNDSGYITDTDLTKHTDNGDIHVTTQEKAKWNGKADKATTLAGYGITDAMTNEQITAAINAAVSSVSGISFEVVSELPTSGEAGKIYLLSHVHGEQDNYDEYIYYNSNWEKIGNTDIDLSGYWLKSDLVSITNEEIDNIISQ